jgi:hypothetical protein
MVFPHRACGSAAGAAPIPVYGWDFIKSLKPNRAKSLRDKVATGRSPVAPATLALRDLLPFGDGDRAGPKVHRLTISHRLERSELRVPDHQESDVGVGDHGRLVE